MIVGFQLIEIALVIALLLVGACLFYVYQTFPIMMTLIRANAAHKGAVHDRLEDFEKDVLKEVDARIAKLEHNAAPQAKAPAKRKVTTS